MQKITIKTAPYDTDIKHSIKNLFNNKPIRDFILIPAIRQQLILK